MSFSNKSKTERSHLIATPWSVSETLHLTHSRYYMPIDPTGRSWVAWGEPAASIGRDSGPHGTGHWLASVGVQGGMTIHENIDDAKRYCDDCLRAHGTIPLDTEESAVAMPWALWNPSAPANGTMHFREYLHPDPLRLSMAATVRPRWERTLPPTEKWAGVGLPFTKWVATTYAYAGVVPSVHDTLEDAQRAADLRLGADLVAVSPPHSPRPERRP